MNCDCSDRCSCKKSYAGTSLYMFAVGTNTVYFARFANEEGAKEHAAGLARHNPGKLVNFGVVIGNYVMWPAEPIFTKVH